MPAYPKGKGPLVLIDESHNNFHTAVGTYKPFATRIERDGYVVKRLKDRISPERLQITDHMPDPTAIEKLADSFGIQVNNGYVLNGYFSGQ